ncbi:SecY-interacting protein Syd [Bacillus sp. Xin]|uniref:SecY-interacting protein Syd n=1 Tax=unclassified Bacillus (in: firmicutes) TaxID=185979 RepID=UPI0015742EC4|nr:MULTISPECIES: SecY-interacting protein Syd [unclassified Bacillus (in: firmicutes)]MBC6972201.1 SecY-interacting protein Syd [Bacillus sp. Xin]NSW36867.1 SecY-interacting protein Syd [Bacillus sp. Xin1]
MKEEMKQYFHTLLKEWKHYNHSLPKSVWREEADSFIYEGEPDTEGYIFWKPTEKDIFHDFSNIERELAIQFHHSIKEYYNSYWFLDLAGNYLEHNLELNSVIPGIELRDFYTSLQGYKKAHHNELKNIPIGIECNGLLIVVDNENGQVNIEDYERGSFEVISNSLAELISML